MSRNIHSDRTHDIRQEIKDHENKKTIQIFRRMIFFNIFAFWKNPQTWGLSEHKKTIIDKPE